MQFTGPPQALCRRLRGIIAMSGARHTPLRHAPLRRCPPPPIFCRRPADARRHQRHPVPASPTAPALPWLRSTWLALLALVLLGSGSLAGGDLFDDDYRDCPARTRLRAGQVTDLAVARDAEQEAAVNVSWTATDPATWGLGPNTYTTALAVLLDDGTKTQTRTVSLGTRKVSFDEVDTGVAVTVQLALVTATADGAYLISDILTQDLHQSLTAPAFMTDKFWRIATLDNPNTPANEEVAEEVPHQTFYYVGYNENFGNYKAEGLVTRPRTPRLRIGLAHAAETKAQREDVDFEAYVLRITDARGDVLPAGDDAATVASGSAYGDRIMLVGASTGTVPAADDPPTQFRNVRINDGGRIYRPSHAPGAEEPFLVTGLFTTPTGGPLAYAHPFLRGQNVVFTMPPDEHRDFPIDTLTSDQTHKFTAWAVNAEGAVISPVASLTVHPVDTKSSNITLIQDYTGNQTGFSNLVLTEFTVLK